MSGRRRKMSGCRHLGEPKGKRQGSAHIILNTHMVTDTLIPVSPPHINTPNPKLLDSSDDTLPL